MVKQTAGLLVELSGQTERASVCLVLVEAISLLQETSDDEWMYAASTQYLNRNVTLKS